jgi:hypothetical protein
MNQTVGEKYTLINKELNPLDFTSLSNTFFTEGSDEEECYAFVTNGAFTQPLFKKQKAFIMTGDGKTFANISFK